MFHGSLGRLFGVILKLMDPSNLLMFGCGLEPARSNMFALKLIVLLDGIEDQNFSTC